MDTEKKAPASEAAEESVKISSKRIKKAERREAKAARKAANKIEEKKTRPNNILIAVLIFGVVVGMFAFVLGYNYFSKPATIEKYIEKNGGEEAYGAIMIDEYTTAKITAEKNSMKIEMTATSDDDTVKEQIRNFYSGEDGKDNVKYIAAYFLTNIKPQTRAFSADVKATLTLNGEELNSAEMTFKEATEEMEGDDEEEEESAVPEDEAAADDADADDAAEAEGGTAETEADGE